MNRGNMRYARIMEKIEVTDEMHERIMKNISSAIVSDGNNVRHKGKILSLRLRYSALAAAGIVLVIIGSFAVKNAMQPKVPRDILGSSYDAGAPYASQYESAAELSDAAGFSLDDVADIPFEVNETEYSLYDDDMAQITYSGETGSLTYRKSRGSEDNSGDYNVYDDEKTVQAGNSSAEIKGSDGKYMLACWSRDGYVYSLSCSEGISEQEMKDMIGSIK